MRILPVWYEVKSLWDFSLYGTWLQSWYRKSIIEILRYDWLGFCPSIEIYGYHSRIEIYFQPSLIENQLISIGGIRILETERYLSLNWKIGGEKLKGNLNNLGKVEIGWYL